MPYAFVLPSCPPPRQVVELGGDKRASISNFKGRTFVDLREWYTVRTAVAVVQKEAETVRKGPIYASSMILYGVSSRL